MKLIIPLAGKGTRLLPVTRRVPKPLVRVAGRTVLDYVMEKVRDLDIEELIVITGHLKEQVEDYITTHYRQPARFIEQAVQDGTAGAIKLAEPYVDGPVLIVFVDTLFDADLSLVNRVDADGIIWAKEVEDYQRFGVVVTDENGYMQRIVEKPSEPISRLANIGLYYLRDWRTLYEGVNWTLAQPQNQGEWYLTDAFQYMIDRGRRIQTAQVGGWYDCGKLDTLLDTNRHLLENGRGTAVNIAGVEVAGPVRIGEGATVEASRIGPNVTIDDGATVRHSSISDTIVGRNARVTGATVSHCLIGDGATVSDTELNHMIAGVDEVAPAP